MSEVAPPAADSQGATAPSAEGVSNSPELPNFKGTKHKIDWGDGNAQELDYDELVNYAKMSKAEMAKAQRLASQLDPAMQFLSALQGGKLDQLAQIVPEDQILAYAEKVLTDRVNWASKSPEERAFLEQQKKFEQEKRDYDAWKQQIAAEKQKQAETQALQQVQQDIVSAINELGLGNKPSPRLVRRVAEQYLAQLQANQNPDVRKASKYEWDNIQKELSEFQMLQLQRDPDKFVESLPKEIRKAIRDYETKRSNPFAKPQVSDDIPSGIRSPKKAFGLDELESYYNPQKKKRAK
jgi:uncharacterized protein (UPF0147 family)